MSEVDNRNSSAAKRARTDGSRREDDWTCPSCGNVNFSFRTTCNMRNCTQPRPSVHNSKSAGKPLQAPQSYSSSAPYVGFGPSSVYLGVPPYGSSLFNGSPVPPYEAPFSGGSAYHYNYGNRLSGGSPYRQLHVPAGPPPYSTGSMIGNGLGGMYGVPPLMDRYGMGLPVAPPPMGPRPGFFPDDKFHKKDATRDDDWKCPNCGNVNFSFRTVCNMRKCNTPKPRSQTPESNKSSKQKMPEGSWKCEKCSNINYPFRTKCNRQNCGAEKPAESKKSPTPIANENDQVRDLMHFLFHLVSYLKLLFLVTTFVHVKNSICFQYFKLFPVKDSFRLSECILNCCFYYSFLPFYSKEILEVYCLTEVSFCPFR
ncbi:ranBP2-type zinc finger protein At1g67325-like isoform X2 [Hibiscus syriacus]|uniref:ranBP2-type zinc finger protein At1g67325-like isoform X2 n=1 Tax=Hibiscus syriacus TaxID=106335 RepID=UPI0019205B4F|nr:ranBP2-type zinc finger protein At1g67325-like isoform X2 [Hibiscus syriacus]